MLPLVASVLISFSIPQRNTLADQIVQWSWQAHREITWGIPDDLPARHGLQGLYAPDEALCQLLEGSPVEYLKLREGGQVVRRKGQPGQDDDEDYCDPPPKTIHLNKVPAGTRLSLVLDEIRRPANRVQIFYLFLDNPYPVVKTPVPAGDYTVKDALCAALPGTGLTFDFESPRQVHVYYERGNSTLADFCAPWVWDTPPNIHVPVADWK